MPKFSIIIPTRNRAHLMRYALQCALNQTFSDYEIIVSDNDSSDDTQKIVKEFATSRVKYFRTSEALPMPDHWDFALDKASGEWVTYLTDDSAISSFLLEEVDRTLAESNTQVVTWSHFSRYFHSTWHNEAERNTLTYHPFSGNHERMNSKTVLKRFFDLTGEHTAPVGLNSFTHRDLIAKIRKRTGRFFGQPCPDLASCAAILGMTESYIYIDLPLGINGIGKESIGMSQATKRDKAANDFHKEFRDAPLFTQVPLHARVIVNYITESLLRIKKALPEELKSVEINWGRYYCFTYENLCYIGARGADVQEEKEEYAIVFKRLPLSMKAQYYRAFLQDKINLNRIKNNIRMFGRRLINGSKMMTALESLIRKRPNFGATVQGSQGGFKNIFEAMQYVDRHAISNLTELADKKPATRQDLARTA